MRDPIRQCLYRGHPPERSHIEQTKEVAELILIALLLHGQSAGKVMLKIFQARPQQYMNRERPDVQAGFRKDRGSRDQSANI